jgi:hypothetical protein
MLLQRLFITGDRSSRASAHERFFAAAADYFLAVRTDGERNARSHILLMIWCSQCVHYTSTRHLLCHMFYDYTLAEIWMLLDVYTG